MDILHRYTLTFMVAAATTGATSGQHPAPGGVLDPKVLARLEDFHRAQHLLLRLAPGYTRANVLRRLDLFDAAPSYVDDQALCEWAGRMSISRLNRIARTPGVLSIEAFSFDSGGPAQ
jgi:hypothetical protein